MMNLVVVTVYWSIIHASMVKELNEAEIVHMYLVHTWPAMCLLMTSMTTERIYLRSKHSVIVIPLGSVYSYVNYLGTIA